MTDVLTAPIAPARRALAASPELERLLRGFRARELARRSRPGAGPMWLDGIARLAPLAVGYGGTVWLAYPLDMAFAVLFAFATTSLLGSWFHDGVHSSIRHPLARLLMRLGAAPVGFSPRWWLLKHVRLHHRYPGNPEFDPDIQLGYVVRVSALQPWRRRHRTQHLHIWPLYALATLNILKPEEARVVGRYARLIELRRPPPGWLLLVDKYVPFALVWTPLVLTHGAGNALRVFIAFHLVAGVLASLITQVQHNTALSGDAVGRSPGLPLCEQLLRTTDVGHGRGVWWWLCGGVNFHIVHHLAPTLTFFELPEVSARLRAALREAGYELPAHAGLWAAVRSHHRLLRQLSRPEGL
ncbi:fatty acid desaturase family protein [Catellatospora vulcania]|uniref:fatty acid desaturase family protein n=1 Tax=Catellatospora vulcania TaxID=1460450 RepID=UPI0012D3C102|nr:fatty acid desaturase [Catellatospora vulcania]